MLVVYFSRPLEREWINYKVMPICRLINVLVRCYTFSIGDVFTVCINV